MRASGLGVIELCDREVDGKLDRMGKAIELAQTQWISDSSRLEQVLINFLGL